MMELIVLGSGSFAPARNGRVRNPAGYALRLGRDVILFDLGFGNLRQLARARLDPADITDVFFTHRHPDHVGDLAALLFLLRYEVKPRSKRLRVWGPRGMLRFWEDLKRAFKPWISPRGYRLQVRELGSGSRVSGRGWEVEALKVPHPTPALAYRLSYKRRRLIYSGDTGPNRRLADFAKGADLFLLECTMPERRSLPGHLTPRQALSMIEASGCRRGVLTHLSESSEAELRRRLKGSGVLMARDLMRLRVE